MGVDKTFGVAFAKSQLAAGQKIPVKGNVFISVRNEDKRKVVFIAKKLSDLGFKLFASAGTAHALKQNDLDVEIVLKVYEGRPNVIDKIKSNQIDLIINTPSGKATKVDETHIRSTAILNGISLVTTISGAEATVNGIEALIKKQLEVKSLQEYHSASPRARK